MSSSPADTNMNDGNICCPNCDNFIPEESSREDETDLMGNKVYNCALCGHRFDETEIK